MNYEEIGLNIKRFRKGKLTQAGLASKIKKSVSSIKKYELGLVEIPNSVLEQIAEALDVSLNDLYGYDINNSGEFETFLAAMGYTVYRDDPEHKPFLISENGVYALEYEDLESFRKATINYLKFTIEETLKNRQRIR